MSVKIEKNKSALNALWKPLSIVVMLLLFAYFFSQQELDKLWHSIKSIPLSIFLLLLVMQVLTQGLLCLQWTLLGKKFLPQCSFWGMFRVQAIGSLVEAVTPGAKVGGELSKLYYMKKDFSCTTETATHIIVIQKSISMSVLFTLCSLAFFMWSKHTLQDVWGDSSHKSKRKSRDWDDDLEFLWQMLLLPLLFLLVLIAPKYHSKVPLPKKLGKILEGFAHSLETLGKKEWLLQFAISTAVWGLFPLKMVLLTASVGLDLDFLQVFAMTMIAYASGMLPLTPGGLGTFEGSMLSLFALLSVETELAFALTIVFRFVTFWFVMILCGLTQIFSNRSRKEQSDV